MGFGDAVSICFRKYVDFSGRAPRSEYWYWTLFHVLSLMAAVFVDFYIISNPTGYFLIVAFVITFLPSFAVLVRRLHDIDKAGWWVLLSVVPYVGAIALLIFCIIGGTPGPNRFGPDPFALPDSAPEIGPGTSPPQLS